MGRLAVNLRLIAALAACVGSEPEQPRRLEAAAVLTGPEPTMVEVRVFRIPPGAAVEQVLLLGPAGERLEAPALRRSMREAGAGLVSRPSLGVAVTGGSASRITPSLSLGWNVTRGDNPAQRSREITARIEIPEPAAYLAAVEQWRVAVLYRDIAGRSRTLSLAAPRFR